MVWKLIWSIAVPDMPDCMVVLVQLLWRGRWWGRAEKTPDVRMDALDAPGLQYEFEVAIRGGAGL